MAWWEEGWLKQHLKEKQIDCLRRLLELTEQEMLGPRLGEAGGWGCYAGWVWGEWRDSCAVSGRAC